MSLTSYRAAPPRVGDGVFWRDACAVALAGVVLGALEDLAATDFPASWDAVS